MGRIRYSAFFIIIIIVSCNNNPDGTLIYDNDLIYIKEILNKEVNYIDENVTEIQKTILINDILDTVSIREINGKEILTHLLDIKIPRSYKKEENKLGYSLFFNDKSNALKSIKLKRDTVVKFLIEHSNILYQSQKEYKLLLNRGLDIEGFNKTFWGDKEDYKIKVRYSDYKENTNQFSN